MKIGILISGRGSNMAAIIEASQNGQIPGSEIVVVISDKADAAGLEKAEKTGVSVRIIEKNGRKRREHDAEILAVLNSFGVELVCLAGYMRLLSAEFVQNYPDKIINIHPSLLPAFKGLDAQRQAFEYGVKIAGCTVHFVDQHLDHGAIILQQAVEVADDDTCETLSAKLLAYEHKLYIEALNIIVSGKYRIEGRRVIRFD